MIDNAARKSIPGRDANLPPYIVQRMKALEVKPTLSQLALMTGIKIMTLQTNLAGATAMKLPNAYKLAKSLDISLSELVENVPFLAEDQE